MRHSQIAMVRDLLVVYGTAGRRGGRPIDSSRWPEVAQDLVDEASQRARPPRGRTADNIRRVRGVDVEPDHHRLARFRSSPLRGSLPSVTNPPVQRDEEELTHTGKLDPAAVLPLPRHLPDWTLAAFLVLPLDEHEAVAA